jgi:hypothetical protein
MGAPLRRRMFLLQPLNGTRVICINRCALTSCIYFFFFFFVFFLFVVAALPLLLLLL